MPTVPYNPEPRVNPEPLPGPRLTPRTPQAPLAAFGGGEGNATPELRGLDQETQAIYQRERENANADRVMGADNQLSDLSDHVLYGNQDQPGILNRHGEDAFKAPEDTMKAWNDGAQKIIEGLGNDDQKRMAAQRAIGYAHMIHEQVQSHVARERDQYSVDQLNGFVAKRAAAAGQFHADGNLDAVDQELAKGAAAFRQYAAQKGKPQDWADEKVSQFTSKVRLDGIKQLLLDDHDQDAAAYLAKHRADLVGPELLEAEQLTQAGSTRGQAIRFSDSALAGKWAPGLETPGNIDLTQRPRVGNRDGSVSTVRSISIEEDGKTVLIPTVSPQGKVLTNDQAIALYHSSGQHLGIFKDGASADAYAERLHQGQARGLQTGDFGPTLTEALGAAQQAFQRGELTDKAREQAETRIRRAFEDKAADQRYQQSEAFDQAQHILEQTHDLEKVPPAVMNRLTSQHRDYLEKREDDLRHPEVRTDLATYTHLKNLASLSESSRAEFEHTDLLPYKDRLSDADFRHMVDLQTSLRLSHEKAGESNEQRKVRIEEAQARKDSITKAHRAEAGAAFDSIMHGGAGKPPNSVPPQRTPAISQQKRPLSELHPQDQQRARENPQYRAYLDSLGYDVSSLQGQRAPNGAPSGPVIPGGPILSRQPQ